MKVKDLITELQKQDPDAEAKVTPELITIEITEKTDTTVAIFAIIGLMTVGAFFMFCVIYTLKHLS